MTDTNEIIRMLGERELDQMNARDALKRGYELGYDKGYSEGVVRGCEMMRVKSKEEPTLSRFLPKMPDDLPELPDGWVYVGRGNVNQKARSFYIAYFFGKKWFYGGWSGCETAGHYAVRIDAPADIWARFGLMPYEDLFFEHVPGDPMPCDQSEFVHVFLKGDKQNTSARRGVDWYWERLESSESIIGWRPADWLKRRESVKGDTE